MFSSFEAAREEAQTLANRKNLSVVVGKSTHPLNCLRPYRVFIGQPVAFESRVCVVEPQACHNDLILGQMLATMLPQVIEETSASLVE